MTDMEDCGRGAKFTRSETDVYKRQALTKRLEGRGIKFETDPPDAFGEFIAMILSVVLPTLLLFGLLMFSMRRMNKGGGIMGMGVGKSKAKAYVQKETGVTFKDVAGQDEAKELSLIHI